MLANTMNPGKTTKSGDADAAADRYDAVQTQVQTACRDIKHYPIIVDRDMAWTDFTRYAEALLDYFEDGVYVKAEHCLPRMERQLNMMKEKADNAYYI